MKKRKIIELLLMLPVVILVLNWSLSYIFYFISAPNTFLVFIGTILISLLLYVLYEFYKIIKKNYFN